MKADSSSSSSPSSDCSNLFAAKRAGLRSSRLCIGGSESEDESSEVDDGGEGGSGLGDRVRGSTVETGLDLGLGDSDRLFNVACAGLGLMRGCGRFFNVIVAFADDVRDNGGATHLSTEAH